MKSTKKMVSDVVTDMNKQREENTEETVRHLVENIVHAEERIKEYQGLIASDKKRLKELQMPETIKLELK